QERSSWMNKGLFKNFRILGYRFAVTGELDQKMISRLKKPFRFPKTGAFFFSLFSSFEIFNYGWIKHLKANHAYELRHAKPYEAV
ncbi:MAG: hypothetical protein JXK95_03070, partial [Bacteroidales bacterium]|nr:hypothetical protein [Bacteroidales bacterium]